MKLPLGTKILILIFLTSGFFHIFNPGVFVPLIPPFLGSKLFWIYISGLAELLSAYGLIRRKSWAPKFTSVVLIIIWVGNWWYAIDITWFKDSSFFLIIGAWLRLPLQIPLIRWALRSPVN
ncbi:MAG: hypothetical protein RLZZ37_58 [Actinomycetota bacterium]